MPPHPDTTEEKSKGCSVHGSVHKMAGFTDTVRYIMAITNLYDNYAEQVVQEN